jgi:transcriptional regulator with XRE-family HTH domain
MTPDELRALMQQQRWTPNSLAALLPVTPRAVRYWLFGKRAIRPVIAERIKSLARESVE